MVQPSSSEPGPRSSELIERGDIDALTFYVDELVGHRDWDELASLRERCRSALERGKQLWAVAAYIEYRLCLEAPGDWAATMLENGSGRFAFGPLPEVAASGHTWSELSPHLHATPQAAMAAHERVVRGDDLTADEAVAKLPAVLDLPLRLQAWEPQYALPDYHADSVEAPPPGLPPLERVAGSPTFGASRRRSAKTAANGHTSPIGPSGHATRDEVSLALEDLVSTWTAESNGRAEAVSVEGQAADAVLALGARLTHIVELAPADALAIMAWAAGDGGAYGRRRGTAPGRFAAWWVLAALGDLTEEWPPPSDALAAVLEGVRWYMLGERRARNGLGAPAGRRGDGWPAARSSVGCVRYGRVIGLTAHFLAPQKAVRPIPPKAGNQAVRLRVAPYVATREAHENSGRKATQWEVSSGTVSPRFVPSQRSASGRTRKASGKP